MELKMTDEQLINNNQRRMAELLKGMFSEEELKEMEKQFKELKAKSEASTTNEDSSVKDVDNSKIE